MSKVTDISTRRAMSHDDDTVAVLESDGEMLIYRSAKHPAQSGTVILTREQAEFALPHLQRWLTGVRG